MQKKFTNADESRMRNNGKGAQTFLNTKVVFAYITLLTNYDFLAIDFYYEENLGSIIQIRKHKTHSY